MGKQDPVALALEVEQDRVEPHDRGCEGGLDQQPGACAQAQAQKLGWRDVSQARHRDLGAGLHLERDPLCGQARVQLIHERYDRVGVVGVAPADVGCGHEHARARGRRGTRQLERTLDRLGAIVDARQHVRVQVDHCSWKSKATRGRAVEQLRCSREAKFRTSQDVTRARRSTPANAPCRRPRRSGRSTGPREFPTPRSTKASRVAL